MRKGAERNGGGFSDRGVRGIGRDRLSRERVFRVFGHGTTAAGIFDGKLRRARIGLAGAFVYEDGKTFTVKEITSLNIRIPHEVLGCADTVYARCLQNGLQNILLISAPGRGKTTILRDLSRQICQKQIVNVLINDERNEIAAASRDFTLDTGRSATWSAIPINGTR